MNEDTETQLRALRWRDPPPEFLARVLDEARRGRTRVAYRRGMLALIPRRLRLPLAACWLLALFFRLTTPDAIPAATLESYAKLPPVTPAQLIAHAGEVERLVDELRKPIGESVPPL
jgi:hypothetical protein